MTAVGNKVNIEIASSFPLKDKVHICTKTDPWTKEKSKRAQHPDAKSTLDTDYSEWYKCPNCGLEFKVELAE